MKSFLDEPSLHFCLQSCLHFAFNAYLQYPQFPVDAVGTADEKMAVVDAVIVVDVVVVVDAVVVVVDGEIVVVVDAVVDV